MRSLRLAVLLLSLAALPAGADTFTTFSSGNWSNVGTWYQNGLPASRYPGSLAGTIDTVTTPLSSYIVTVDVALAERVTLTTSCPSNTSTCRIDVIASGSLLLTGASSIGTDAKLRIDGGTIDNASILTTNGTIEWLSGTLGGSGSTTANGAVNAMGPGNMILGGGQTLSLFGTLTYSGGQLRQNGGSDLIVKSGAVFDLQIINGITTDNGITATINVDSGGLFKKSNGNFGTNIDPMFFNNGTVQVDVASMGFQRGTYNGTFVLSNASVGIGFAFPGTHTFNGTSTISGAGQAFFGGTVSIPGTLNVSNFANDNFASFSGVGTINLSGTWTWRGAIINGITINAASTATVNYTAESNTTLSNNAHLNNQGILNLNTGAGALSINSGAHITNDGDLNLLGDVSIFSNALSNARIDNLAGRTFDKTTGASNATINPVFHNAGNVSVASGGIKFTRGGTHSGNWSTSATTSIEFAGGTNQFLGGTMTGSGTYGLAAGTMDVDVPILTLQSALAFKLTGGVLTGSGNFRVEGPFTWTGGAMNNSSGNGQTILTGAPNQIAPASPVTLSGRTLSHTGSVTYTGTTAPNILSINDGGTFLNTGSFIFSGDDIIGSNNNASPRFVNGTGGALTKNSGAGSAQFLVYFQSDSSINLGSGSIKLSGGGQNLGVVNFSGPANRIFIDNSVFGISTTPGLNGNGWIAVTGTNARLVLLAPMTVENLELQSGRIDSGALTVNTQMIWKSGQLGPGGSTTLNTATLDHSAPTGGTTIDNHAVHLNGSTYTFDGTTFPLTLTNGSAIHNNSGSTFNSAGAGSVNAGAGTNSFNNGSTATLRKSGGTSGTRFDVAVHNAGGTISSEVNGQSLILNGGGTMTGGSLQATGTAFFDFFGGTFTRSGGNFTGTGKFRVLGTGTLAFTASAAIASGFELHNGGTIDVQSPSVVAFDNFGWHGGTMAGAGQKRIMAGGVITNAAPSMLAQGLLDINAQVDYSGDNTNFLTIGTGAQFLITSSGTLGLATDGRIAGAGTLTNQGTLVKTGGGGTSAIDVPFTSNAAGIDINTGKLQFSAGGTMSGTSIDIGPNALEFSGGTMSIQSGSSMTGTGTLRLSGGTTSIQVPLTLPFLALEGGTLAGSGNLVLGAGGFWNSGTINGPGQIELAAGKTFDINGGMLTLDRVFRNKGTLRFQTASCGIFGSNAASILNDSVTEFLVDASIWIGFGNSGTVNVNGFQATFNNVVTGAGNWNLGTGSVLWMSFATAISGGSISGTGTLLLGSSPSDIKASVNLTSPGKLIIDGGATFNASTVTVPSLEMRTGTLDGSSAINLTGGAVSIWKGGTIAGSGAFAIPAGVTFTIDGSLGAMTLARNLTNDGTIDYNATNALSFSGATLTNAGTFNVHNSTAIGGSGTFTNNGTFVKLGGAGTMNFAPAFTNSNTVTASSGHVGFDNGYTQSAGTTTLDGGHIGGLGSSVVLNGGILRGNGTIPADLVNNATIRPGMSPGIINVNADYTQGATGVLEIELAGASPAQYDRLAVSGNATLDGTLNVTFLGGYLPAGGETYDVLTFSSKSGDFATKNLPVFPAGGAIVASYEPPATPVKLQLTALVTQADMAVSQTPSTAGADHGDTVSFTVTITNNGMSTATSIGVTDSFTNATFVSANGPLATCSGTGPVNCTIGTLAAGQSTTITITLLASSLGTITNTASVAAVEFDPNTANNGPVTSSIVVGPRADLKITKSGPASTTAGGTITYTITVKNEGPSDAANVVVDDPRPTRLSFAANSGDCTTAFPCSLGSINAGATKTITSTWNVAAGSEGNTITNTATVTSSTPDHVPANNSSSTSSFVSCTGNSVPTNLAPSNGTVPATGTLSWTGGSGNYAVYLGVAGSGCSTHFANTSSNSISYSLAAGTTYEWRVDSLLPGCQAASSNCVTFTTEGAVTCNVPQAPHARVVGQTTSAKTYSVEWDAVPGATRYEIDEALNAEFTNATTTITSDTSKAYKHDVAQATGFYYRVRAFNDCQQLPSANSVAVRVVIVPLPPKDEPQQEVNVPAGSEEVIVQEIFIPGQANQTLFFNASTDRPWLTVTPASGVLPPQGVTLHVTANPKTLPNGTFTASVIVTITDNTATNVSAHGTTTTSIPLSINLVTPVSPVQSKPATSAHALIIPSVGHLDGIDSQWRSDVRITNAGFRAVRYALTFTPSGGTARGVKQTTITVDAGATTALDDIVRNWYGIGALGESTNGMLEILPLDDPAVTSLATVASSRTYNLTNNGTLGQFIPAIRSNALIGKALSGALPQILSLQQIAQNQLYRTNVGVAEGSGNGASVLLRIFDANGLKLRDVPLTLAAGEQRQLNSLLASQGVELADGRIEVQVLDGSGKVTAYASVVDNTSKDPLLVAGTPLTQSNATRWVLPGAANLSSEIAQWRTDMRVFNYGAAPQNATLTFYAAGSSAPKTANVTLNAGAVLTLDNIVESLFGSANSGGVVHLTTGAAANLVVTGRTYNQTANGTFGQFIPAVTSSEATGAGERPLNILQVEDSVRYRTNIGVAEVTGQPATIEVQVYLPDSKATPTVTIPLAANEFRQFNVIRAMGLGAVYNARVVVRVVAGQGRVAAYGSVIDETTQDPTYVPAQ
jgi:uncharacterized repeat protein (TIGR01451 family)